MIEKEVYDYIKYCDDINLLKNLKGSIENRISDINKLKTSGLE